MISQVFSLVLPIHLVHPFIGYFSSHGRVFREDCREPLHHHEAGGEMNHRTVMVHVDLLAGHFSLDYSFCFK